MPKIKINTLFRNKNGKVIGVIKGEIKNNVFSYKENTLFGFGGKFQTLNCDQEGIIDLDKKRAILIYDNINGDWVQFIPKQSDKRTDQESMASLMSDTRIAMLERDQMLEKPANLKALLEFMFLVLLIVAIIAIVWETNNATKNLNNLYAPFNNQTKIMSAQQQFEINNTRTMIQICRLTLSALTKNITGLQQNLNP